MKKATKDKISKFLFDTLSKEQKKQMGHTFECKTMNFEPPLLKVKESDFCVKVEIKLIPGTYGK